VAAGTAEVPIDRVCRFDQIVEAHTDQRQARRHDRDGFRWREDRMKIAVLGAGRVGSTVGSLWHAAGHNVTFAARHTTRPQALAAELAKCAQAASVATPRRPPKWCSWPSRAPL
jgi:phosphoglycerate dehydrogenase-like enzyme